MSLANSEDFKELVRSRTDLVQLVGESATLTPQRGGRGYVCLCPFHDDHNPSMQVNPERQSWRCWVCNEGGDAFSFVMKLENVSFKEALELLATRAGVEIPRKWGGESGGVSSDSKARIYEVLNWATQEFHRFLLQGQGAERARRYLTSRQFSDETIAQFQIGYHPNQWEWLLERARNRFSPEELLAARLIGERSQGNGYYDNFVDRVLFPICDERGRPVAFGGRILPDASDANAPKYWNSPEGLVFSKSKLAFGLDHARDAIKKTGIVCVVEGYTDCIKAHQAGVRNVVGTLGTALTEMHVTMLKRLARTVVLVYDGDEAGVRAAERAIPRFLAQDVDLRILTLPEELDPDEYLDKYGAEAFGELVAQSPEAWDYQLRLLSQRYGLGTTDGRMRVLEGLLELLAASPGIEGTLKETVLLSRLPVRLAIPEQEIRKRLTELRQGLRRKEFRRDGRSSADGASGEVALGERKSEIVSLQRSATKDDLLECELIQILLTAPHMMEVAIREVGADDFRRSPCRELFEVCCDLWDHGWPPAFEKVVSHVECPQLKGFAVWLEEQATLRNLGSKLALDASSLEGSFPLSGSSGETSKTLLDRVLDGFRWRRKRALHQAAQGRLLAPTSSTELNSQTRELLARATQFHQQRNQKS